MAKTQPQKKHRHAKSMVRYHRFRTIERKKQIIRAQNGYWHFEHEGSLSKGKIHCSCPMCRRKSRDLATIADMKASDGAIYGLIDEGIRAEPFIAHERARVKRSA